MKPDNGRNNSKKDLNTNNNNHLNTHQFRHKNEESNKLFRMPTIVQKHKDQNISLRSSSLDSNSVNKDSVGQPSVLTFNRQISNVNSFIRKKSIFQERKEEQTKILETKY